MLEGYILAGGEGTRLGHPIRAKPLYFVAGTRLFLSSSAVLKDMGYSLAVPVLHFEAKHAEQKIMEETMLNNTIKEKYGKPPLIEMHPISSFDVYPDHNNPNFMGTAHALFSAYEYFHRNDKNLPEEPVAVFSGDNVYNGKFGEFLEIAKRNMKENGALATIIAYEFAEDGPHLDGYGLMTVERKDKDAGKVTAFHEKNEYPNHVSTLVNISAYLLSPKLIKFMKEKFEKNPGYNDFGQHVFPDLVKDGAVYAVRIPQEEMYWADIATREKALNISLEIKERIKKGEWNMDLDFPVNMEYNEAIDSLVPVGFEYKTDVDGYVKNSVLSRGAEVLSNSVVKNSTIGVGTTIAGNSEVENASIDNYVTIVNHTKIDGREGNPVIVGRKAEITGPINVEGGTVVPPNSKIYVSEGVKDAKLTPDTTFLKHEYRAKFTKKGINIM